MTHISRYAACALALATFAAWTPAQADDFKAGFVHTERVFREANTAKAA